jgi:VWFA-related protein
MARLVAFLLATSALALCQQPAASPEQAPTFRTSTRVVVEDVVVTDSHGIAVHGLTAEDFSITEDGQLQQVNGFSFHELRPDVPLSPQEPLLTPGVYSNRHISSGTDSPLNIIVMDVLNTSFQDQAYARYEMLRFMKAPPPGPIAVFELGNRLQVLQDFTSDPKLLKAAIEAESGKVLPWQRETLERQELPGLPANAIDSMEDSKARQAAYLSDNRVTITLDALASIAHAVRGTPGRKNIIWVTGGFPLSLEPHGRYGSGNRSYVSPVDRVTNMLAEAQIAVYPVDARGLMGSPIADSSWTGRDSSGRVLMGNALQDEISTRMLDITAPHETMDMLAQQTGGRAFYNRNDLDRAVAAGIEDGSTYYSVAYSPTNHEWNGKFRKIKIKLARPRMRLRYRPGYYALDTQRPMPSNEKELQRQVIYALSAPIPPNDVVFDTRAEKKQQSTVLHIMVSAESMQEALQSQEQVTLDFVAVALKRRRILSKIGKTVLVSANPQRRQLAERQGFPFELVLPPAPDSERIRILVRERASGKVGVLEIPADVAAGAN